MSYCGAFPGESEHILIDACLASVRANARLDEEPVLPPLHVLLGSSGNSGTAAPSSRRLVWPSAGHKLPTAEAIVKSAFRPPADPTSSWRREPMGVDTARRRSARTVSTESHPKTFVQLMRWPVFLCGFVAGIFGGVAVMKSPVGQKPAVQHVTKVVQGHVYAAAAGAKRITRR